MFEILPLVWKKTKSEEVNNLFGMSVGYELDVRFSIHDKGRYYPVFHRFKTGFRANPASTVGLLPFAVHLPGHGIVHSSASSA
jgi:hypothetical protein